MAQSSPPTVTLSDPLNGATLAPGVATAVTATASVGDVTRSIASVTFHANGVLLGSKSVAPFSYNWTPTEAGTYWLTAVATDTSGSQAVSGGVSVVVSGAPVFTTQPQSQVINTWGTVTFYAQATAPTGGAVTYQWKKNGVVVTGDPNTDPSVLRLHNVLAGAAGGYTATATTATGSSTSAPAVLTVLAPEPGTVVAWGDPALGQTLVPTGLTRATAIGAGPQSTVAVRYDGTVMAWSDNDYGQATVPAGLTNVTAVASGLYHTLALKRDGTVAAWGLNAHGQTRVPDGLSGVVAVAAGDYFSVALKGDGTVLAWGLNDNGQATVPAGLTGVSAIAACGNLTMVLKTDGTVVKWGVANSSLIVPAGLNGVVGIAAGRLHLVALKNDGTVVAWGDNTFGQATVPAGLSGVKMVAAGGRHTVALKNDGTVVLWGSNSFGQATALSGLTGVTAIAAGQQHTVALIGSGLVNQAPSFTTDPTARTVLLGGSTTFTVVVGGVPTPALQWQRQAAGTTGFVDLLGGGVFSGGNTASLSVNGVTLAMSGDQFRCVASNGVGGAVISLTAQLTVVQAPQFTSSNQLFFAVGQVGTFTLAATAVPAPTYSVSAGTLPVWLALNAATGVLSGTPPSATGSPFTFTVQAANGVGTPATQVLTLSVQGPLAPSITSQPQSRAVALGQTFSFSVEVVGTGPITYQWRKNGTDLPGATAAKYTVTSAQASDAGTYSVRVANSVGSLVSADATLALVVAGATHAIVGGGYAPGATLTITSTITYSSPASALGWQVLLPPDWSYVSESGGATQASVRPEVGQTGFLEWAWSTIPASPITFTYTLNVPLGQSADQQIAAVFLLRELGQPATFQLLALPDPLLVHRLVFHSADSDHNGRISLLELTRVIELYNTRNGSTRTGCYRLDAAGEDGFAPEPTRASSLAVSLSDYHLADSDHNGRISLLELTRVIEIYNFRSGTVRTGAYRVQIGTEDGFAPGP